MFLEIGPCHTQKELKRKMDIKNTLNISTDFVLLPTTLASCKLLIHTICDLQNVLPWGQIRTLFKMMLNATHRNISNKHPLLKKKIRVSSNDKKFLTPPASLKIKNNFKFHQQWTLTVRLRWQ